MSHTVERVEKWVAKQHEKGSVEGVAAVQISRTGNGELIDRVIFHGGMETEDFAREIFDTMQEDADALEPGQPGKYTLHLFFKGEEEAPPLTLAMSVMGTDNEAPSLEDQFTAQALRHQEINMVTAMRGPEMSLSDNRSMIQLLLNQNRELIMQSREDTMTMRKILLDQQELEMAREKAKTEAFLIGKVVEQAEMIVPMVIGQLMKKKPEKGEEPEPLPELMDIAQIKLLLNFTATLDSSQQEQLQAILEPIQKMALGAILADPKSSDAVDPILIPMMVGRILNTLTADQVQDIQKLLISDEQSKAWEAVYRMRKLSIGWQKEEFMLIEKQKAAASLEASQSPNGAGEA